MLELKQIKKQYLSDSNAVVALNEVSVAFRKSEFVSILGPSGCGKTTLLNIIGGLDQYTSGDLVIDGVSTKVYKDADWDRYRNHSIGFVFQNYNLIPHQTVLQNVELALTLSGVSKAERRRRASKALEEVGLGDQLKKKPNQLSGGQMQRVAIARALVNNPEILMADEPTGALDTATSIQVMELLKKIANDRLVIMVTHNPELAERYSTRIIRLLDGKIVGDTNPVDEAEVASMYEAMKGEVREKKKKKSMSLATAMSLSMKNLLTKKTRTFLTSFAGSIGIIGIALIMSLSNGINIYINRVQEDTLSTTPISLTKTTQDYSALMNAMTENKEAVEERTGEEHKVYISDSMAKMMSAMYSTRENDLKAFKAYIEAHQEEFDALVTSVQYNYDYDMWIYSEDGKTRINPTTIFDHMDDRFKGLVNMMQGYSSSANLFSMLNVFSEMIGNDELLQKQYDVIAGSWATEKNQVMLVVDKNYSITNMVAYILGLEDQEGLADAMNDVLSGKGHESAVSSYDYDEFIGMKFYVVPSNEFFAQTERTYEVDGVTYPIWKDVRDASDFDQVNFAKEHGVEVEICGIIQPSPGAVATAITGAVAYRTELSQMVMEKSESCDLGAQQKATPLNDVFSGVKFEKTVYTPATAAAFVDSLSEMKYSFLASTLAQRMGIDPSLVSKEMVVGTLQSLDEATFAAMTSMFQESTDATYEDNLAKIGVIDEAFPSAIKIYAKDFDSKDKLATFIEQYNEQASDESQIKYVDLIGVFLSGITTIIDVISYVLIAFVSISLVVSSIMIGIITYISVLERIKEIGILRAIGASKRDISRVFNAETLIVGFGAGVIGIAMTLILCLPINAIIHYLSGINNVNAVLPWQGGIFLVLLSMILTFIAGLIPAKIASKKDPVVALRTE